MQGSASYYNARANVYDEGRNDTGSAWSTNNECRHEV